MKSNPKKYIFTEDIDYSKTPKQSIWGSGDSETLQVLESLAKANKLSGDWLNFAAGDGRYNNLLLKTVNKVIATDIDKGALDKLYRITPKKIRSKLSILTHNILEPFSFDNNTFDGVFNTGTLHLFPESIIETVVKEAHRILKSKGIFIFDFATDIKRIKPDGSFIGRSGDIYTKSSAKKILAHLLEDYEFKSQFIYCKVQPEEVITGDGKYTFSCNYWLIIAEK